MTDRAQASEEAGNKWVYVKVKRKKSTYFLHIDLTETILEVKAKLQDLVQKVQSGDHQDDKGIFGLFYNVKLISTFQYLDSSILTANALQASCH